MLVPPVPYPWPTTGSYTATPLLTNLRPNNPPPNNKESYCKFSIDWSLYPGNPSNQPCYLMNLQIGAPNTLDAVRCIAVDNSYCPFDVHIQFTDGFTLTIPAYEPFNVYPAITQTLQFQVWPESSVPFILPTGADFVHTPSTIIYVANANIPPLISRRVKQQSGVSGLLSISAVGAGLQIVFNASRGSFNSATSPFVQAKTITASCLLTTGAAGADLFAEVQVYVDALNIIDTKVMSANGVSASTNMMLVNLQALDMKIQTLGFNITSNGSLPNYKDFFFGWNLLYEDKQGYNAL
jgi:hypothetical protein